LADTSGKITNLGKFITPLQITKENLLGLFMSWNKEGFIYFPNFKYFEI